MRWFWKLIHNAVAHPALALTSSAWAVTFHDWTAEKAWPTAEPDKLALFDALREAQEIAEEAGNEAMADSLNTLALLWATGKEEEASRALDPLAAELLREAGLGEDVEARKIAERVAAQFQEEKRETIQAGYEEVIRLSRELTDAAEEEDEAPAYSRLLKIQRATEEARIVAIRDLRRVESENRVKCLELAEKAEEIRQLRARLDGGGVLGEQAGDSVEREIWAAEARERRDKPRLTPGLSEGAAVAPTVGLAGFRFGNRLLAWLDRNGAWIIEPLRDQLRSIAAELDGDADEAVIDAMIRGGAMQVENQRSERERQLGGLRGSGLLPGVLIANPGLCDAGLLPARPPQEERLESGSVTPWQPIATAPEGVPVVVGWKGDDEIYPDCHDFDIKEEDDSGVWRCWEENREHAEACAPPGSIMPGDTPPYAYWMPLPALPGSDPA